MVGPGAGHVEDTGRRVEAARPEIQGQHRIREPGELLGHQAWHRPHNHLGLGLRGSPGIVGLHSQSQQLLREQFRCEHLQLRDEAGEHRLARHLPHHTGRHRVVHRYESVLLDRIPGIPGGQPESPELPGDQGWNGVRYIGRPLLWRNVNPPSNPSRYVPWARMSMAGENPRTGSKLLPRPYGSA